MFAAEARGELEEGTAKDWAHHTKNIKSLPERVGKKKKKKKRSKSASVFLRPSLVHGTGLFVSRDIRRGEKIARAMIRMRGEDSLDRYELTKAARYTNHSQEPTARLAKEGHEIYLAALQDISAGDEIFVDYRKTSAALGPGSYLTYQGKKRVSAERLEKQAELPKSFSEFADSPVGRFMTAMGGKEINPAPLALSGVDKALDDQIEAPLRQARQQHTRQQGLKNLGIQRGGSAKPGRPIPSQVARGRGLGAVSGAGAALAAARAGGRYSAQYSVPPVPPAQKDQGISYAYMGPNQIQQHSPRRQSADPLVTARGGARPSVTPMQAANQLMRPGAGNPRNIFTSPGQGQTQTLMPPAWHAQARPRVTPKLTIPAPRQTLPKTTPGVSLAAGGVTKYESAIPGYQGTLIDRGMRLLEKQAEEKEEGKGFMNWAGGLLSKLVDSPEKQRFWNVAGSDPSTPGRNAVDKAVDSGLTTWAKNYHAQQRAARRGPPVRTQSSLPKRPFNIQQTDAQRGVPKLPEVARSTGRPLLTVRDDRAQPPATPNLVSPTQGVNQPRPSGFGTPRDVFTPPGQKTLQTLTPPAWHAQDVNLVAPRLRSTVPQQKPSRPAESQGDLIARGTGLLGQKYNQTAANTKPTSLTVTR